MNRCGGIVGALLALAAGAGLTAAQAETFLLQGGERIEGEVVRSIGKTVSIKLPGRGMRQMPVSAIQEVAIELTSGETIAGVLLGWSDGAYSLGVGDQSLTVQDGAVIREVATAPAVRPEVAAPEGEPDTGLQVDPGAASEGIGGPEIALADPEAVAEEDAAPPGEPPLASLPVLTGASLDADEGDGAAVIELKLSVAAATPIVVIYSAMDGTATAGADFERNAGVLTIEPGQRAAEVRIPLIDDDLAEPDEEFELFLSVDPAAAETGDRHVIARIRDNDS